MHCEMLIRHTCPSFADEASSKNLTEFLEDAHYFIVFFLE